MKKLFRISIILLAVLFMTLGFVSCKTTIGQKFIEQKPSITFTSNNYLYVSLMNKGNKIADTFEGKASTANIYFESLKNDEVKLEALDKIYLTKDEAEQNPDYVKFYTPEVYDEVGYPIENFNEAYYKDKYAMLFGVDLNELLSDEKFNFVTDAKYVKITIELNKGYESSVKIKASYDFYLEVFDGKLTEDSVMTECSATFNRSRKDIISLRVFAGHKLSDFEGYILDERSKLDGLTSTWYLYQETLVENIFDYTFPEEDLADDVTIFTFTLIKADETESGEDSETNTKVPTETTGTGEDSTREISPETDTDNVTDKPNETGEADPSIPVIADTTEEQQTEKHDPIG